MEQTMVSEPAMQNTSKPRNINAKIAEFVKLVSEVGPDIPLVAKKMGEHKESVRYWFKKILKQGIVIQPSVNFEKIGLSRVVVVVDFAKEFESQAEPILIAMSQLCYVQAFVKTLPEGHYIVHGAVPVESVSSWIAMMRRLGEEGLFTSLEFSTYDSARNAPMKSDLYDFDAGRWDFEWSTPAKVYPEVIEGHSPKAQVDKIDLEIIRRLQRDETKPLSEIQKETGINYKTLSFHHRKHVLGRQMLKGHKVNWIGTAYNPESDNGKHRRHTYQPIDVIIRDITPSEKATVMGLTNALPFLWWEASGKSSYYAELAFPTETISEAMEFLARALLPVKDRARWFMADQKHSRAFGLEPRFYDSDSKVWMFNPSEVIGKFEQLLMQVKRGS
jgi:DNA-binding Lrp family transcriptional regulator